LKRTVLSLDSAFKTGQANDYSAMLVWGEAQAGFYLLPAWRGRVEFPELKHALMNFYEQWRPNHVLVEDAASGQSLLQELRVSTSLPLKPIKPDRDKVSRAQACTGVAEAGRVFLPQDAPWLNDYPDELSSFPSAAHDDQVDATTMALNFLRSRPSASGLRDYYRSRESCSQTPSQSARARGEVLFPVEESACHWLKG
jgi:predicted phage terminase large subunit-like protein